MNVDIELYIDKNIFLKSLYEEINYRDFYRDIFPKGSFERAGIYEDNKGNGIAVSIEGEKYHRVTITDELDQLDKLINDDFVITNGISYFGNERSMKNATLMYALVFDIDGINELSKLKTLLHHFNSNITPKPTYLVNSGHGVHLYFVFKEPIPLYNHLKETLKQLKYYLTKRIWNPYVSSIEEVQYQGINQGFRMVGSPTKFGHDYRLTAFKTGDKVDLNYLNDFVFDEDIKVETTEYSSLLSLEEAKIKYPEWYERKIINKQRNQTWIVKRDLYEWWIRKIKEEATFGHRYFCIMALSIYAIKCNISFDELKKDAYDLIPYLNNIKPDEPFTKADVDSALKAYNTSYKYFPREDIEKITSIEIPQNKRNGRSQELHLKGARAIQNINDPEGTWRYVAPSKKQKVLDYIKEHPEANPTEIAKALKVSRTTVYKYLNSPEVI